MMDNNKNTKVVIFGGGVGSSTFAKALVGLPIEVSVVVSSFDDGGSTGSLRNDYGGIALGDLRQVLIQSSDLPDEFTQALNVRFASGLLKGVNVGNVLLKAFLNLHESERDGVIALNKLLRLKHSAMPISYSYAKLFGKTRKGDYLSDQDEIAKYLNFSDNEITEIGFDKSVDLNPDVKNAIDKADYLIFAPGHFFTSVLPHIFVPGFAQAWENSSAKKIWFYNLLAHKGQDDHYSLKDYLLWFQKQLGLKPFDAVFVNRNIPEHLLSFVDHRFTQTRCLVGDKKLLSNLGIKIAEVDLLSATLRKKTKNDSVFRAPLKHEVDKVKSCFENLVLASHLYDMV